LINKQSNEKPFFWPGDPDSPVEERYSGRLQNAFISCPVRPDKETLSWVICKKPISAIESVDIDNVN